MKTFGIIAEFNPFHNGHYYLIEQAKALNATHIAVALSSNFVQRADAAIVSKFTRTKMALECGSDLVAELPVPFSMASAMTFSKGAIAILKNFCDALIFGSECNDINKLNAVVQCLQSEKYNKILKASLNSGKTFAAIRESAVNSIIGSASKILQNPNDTLAVEYMLAAAKQNAQIEFIPVKRVGAEHDSQKATSNICSSSFIRANIDKSQDFMPKAAYEIFIKEIKSGNIADINELNLALLANLRQKTAEDFKSIPDISEGLENRITAAAANATTLDEFYNIAKTKRYTLARLRRIALSSFLNINKEDSLLPLPYIRPLGANTRGLEIIKNAKDKTIPILTSLKDAERISDKAKRMAQLEAFSTDIYGLCLKNKHAAAADYKYKFLKVK